MKHDGNRKNGSWLGRIGRDWAGWIPAVMFIFIIFAAIFGVIVLLMKSTGCTTF